MNDIERQLPSASFCALKAYNLLKDGSMLKFAEQAIAWATLGNLISNLSSVESVKSRQDIAARVAKAAHAVAINDTEANRRDLQQALLEWIESE